jgi:hypothetical protein
MNVGGSQDPLTKRQTGVFLIAQTFEEERIVKALTKVFTTEGAEVSLLFMAGPSQEPIEFTFHVGALER